MTEPSPPQNARATFVGRDRELSELRRAIDDALGGHGRLFLLGGEAGIGKTRLAEELANEASGAGMAAVWGRCNPGAQGPPYLPFVQVLRAVRQNRVGADPPNDIANGSASNELMRILPELRASRSRAEGLSAFQSAEAGDPEKARNRLFEAAASQLKHAARAKPLLIVLDDLHDGGIGAWLMLRYIATEIHDAPLAIVVVFRQLELRELHGIEPVHSDLLRVGQQISLTGLSEAEIAEFVRASAGYDPDRRLVSTVYRATGGNPFFVTEVVRMLAARGAFDRAAVRDPARVDVPDSVRVYLRGRLAALPARAAQVLATAAVLGNQFELALLESVCAQPAAELIAAIEASLRIDLVIEAPGAGRDRGIFQFAHALIREAILDDLGTSTRLHLHKKILAVLEERYRGDPEPHLDELAYHAAAAAPLGERGKAIDYAQRAGEFAYAAFDYEQAAHHWQTALAMMEQGSCDPKSLAATLERLGDALWIIEDEQPRAIECLLRAARLHERAGGEIEGARVRARLAMKLSKRSPAMNVSRALEQYQLAEKVLGRLPDSEMQIWLYAGFADAAMQGQRVVDGLAASRRALDIANRLGSERGWRQAAVRHADQLFNCAHLAEAVALADQAWHRADQDDDLEGAFEAAWSGGYFNLTLWDPRAARHWFERELERPRLKQAAYQRHILMQQIAFSCVFTGELSRARELLAETPRALIEGFLFLYEGEWEKAERLLDGAREAVLAAGSRDLAAVHSFFQAIVLRVASDLASADALIARALESSIQGGVISFELILRTEAALIAVSGGRIENARAHLVRCRQIMAAGEDWRGHRGRVAIGEAIAAAAQGSVADGARRFAEAIAIFQRYSLPWEQAQAHHLWARAVLAAGDRAKARENFAAALAIYRRYGAGSRWLDQIGAELSSAQGAAVSLAKGQESADSRPVEQYNVAILRDEGEYWTIEFRGAIVRVRATRGLRAIACLLIRANQRIPARELAARARSRTANGSPPNQPPRDGRAALPSQASSERARVVVTKNIKSTMAKIRALEPSLGRHLFRSIRTGAWCSYAPDPDERVAWRLETSGGAILDRTR